MVVSGSFWPLNNCSSNLRQKSHCTLLPSLFERKLKEADFTTDGTGNAHTGHSISRQGIQTCFSPKCIQYHSHPPLQSLLHPSHGWGTPGTGISVISCQDNHNLSLLSGSLSSHSCPLTVHSTDSNQRVVLKAYWIGSSPFWKPSFSPQLTGSQPSGLPVSLTVSQTTACLFSTPQLHWKFLPDLL